MTISHEILLQEATLHFRIASTSSEHERDASSDGEQRKHGRPDVLSRAPRRTLARHEENDSAIENKRQLSLHLFDDTSSVPVKQAQ